MLALILTLTIAAPLAAGQPAAPPGAVLSVPFLPQTEALCGGAAAAMVMRFLGDRHADVQQFAPLVDRRAGGIAQNVLVAALRSKGWTVAAGSGSIEALAAALERGAPPILLIEDRPSRYHYVVAVGMVGGGVLVHDPTWGPARPIPRDELLQRWGATGYWFASLAPPAPPVETAATPASRPPSPRNYDRHCTALLDAALDAARPGDLSDTERRLQTMRSECPRDPRPIRELAGVRFAQKDWDAAAAFAREAAAMDPGDRYTWDLLGSSRFMLDDLDGALDAWNHNGEPLVDRVQIDGLRRTRYSNVAEILGVPPNTLLTPRALQLARRRLEQLPDRVSSRIRVTPGGDGYAVVQAVVVERPRAPEGAVEWGAAALQTGIDREVSAVVPGYTGQGEVWRADWRWWERRPRVHFGFAAPAAGRFGGVWAVDFERESQTYAASLASALVPDGTDLTRETRTRGMLTFSRWLAPGLRVTAGAGAESWEGSGGNASFLGAIERRAFDDRVIVQGTIDAGRGLGAGPSYSAATVSVAAATSTAAAGFVLLGGASHAVASRGAPLALWSGAGDGRARPGLLRAHRLLREGVIDGAVFGRHVTSINLEARRWLAVSRLVPIAAAAFVDAASAADRPAGLRARASQVDAGAGVRLRLPGRDGTLRVDYARGLRDGASAWTVGWSVW